MQRVFRTTLVLSATFRRTPNMHAPRRLLLLLLLHPRPPPLSRALSSGSKPTPPSTTTAADDNEDEWNEAWEAAWLPEDDLSARTRAPWESPDGVQLPDDPLLVDSEAKAFVEEMEERWDERRKGGQVEGRGDDHVAAKAGTRDPVEEYRLRKQRIHASMWMREIEKLEESRLHAADPSSAGAAEIDRLLDSCSEIFNSGNNDLNDMDIPGSAEFKMKPDGWETTSKTPDGNIWEVTQREEDILLQEFERRIAFCKFQISSFIKTHIFSRRRPIDGWKYMIEELGPNARKSKGSVQRLPAVSDPATQPFKEERAAPGSTLTPFKG